jgi:hypothetical protein
VAWIAEITPARGLRRPIRYVSAEETLFGTEVVAHGDGVHRQAFRLAAHDDRVRDAVAALLRGAQAGGLQLSEVTGLSVPTDPADFAQVLDLDRAALRAKLDRYQELRSEIDQRMARYIDA